MVHNYEAPLCTNEYVSSGKKVTSALVQLHAILFVFSGQLESKGRIDETYSVLGRVINELPCQRKPASNPPTMLHLGESCERTSSCDYREKAGTPKTRLDIGGGEGRNQATKSHPGET